MKTITKKAFREISNRGGVSRICGRSLQTGEIVCRLFREGVEIAKSLTKTTEQGRNTKYFLCGEN